MKTTAAAAACLGLVAFTLSSFAVRSEAKMPVRAGSSVGVATRSVDAFRAWITPDFSAVLASAPAGAVPYGNYCGPDRNGHDFQDDPIDCVDAACMAHDTCYAAENIDWLGPYSPERGECDCDLVCALSICLIEVPERTPQRDALDFIMALFCTFLEANNVSCPCGCAQI